MDRLIKIYYFLEMEKTPVSKKYRMTFIFRLAVIRIIRFNLGPRYCHRDYYIVRLSALSPLYLEKSAK